MIDTRPPRGNEDFYAAVRIPHPLECRRPRPPRQPTWLPTRTPVEGAERRSAFEHWREPRLEAAPDTGQMRIRFSYDAWFTTVAGFSDKTGRAVYHEGPVEAAAWIDSEVSTGRIDLQFQPVRVVWRRDHGGTRQLTLDAGFEDETNNIWFTEYKGHRAYFDDPHTADLLDEAQEVLRAQGADLSREDRTHLLDPVLHRARKDVFDDRRTTFDPDRDASVALEAILREGGMAPLGKVHEALGGEARDAAAKLNAMSVRRIVRIDLSRPQMPDVAVDIPPPATAARLRTFLKRFARAETD